MATRMVKVAIPGILALMLFLTVNMRAADAPPPATKPATTLSKTIGAWRSVQVQWDRSGGFRPDLGATAEALTRSEQTAALAKEILGLPALPPRALNVFTKIEEQGANVSLDLNLWPPDARHAAAEFMDALVGLLRADLERQQDTW